MRPDDAQPIIDELFDHLDRGVSWRTDPGQIPASRYADPAHLDRELDRLFTATPQAVALAPDLADRNSYLTRDTPTMGVILTRDGEGEIHAMANVCAHRGARVVSNVRGCQRRLTCPYHAWTYDLDGSLVGLPDREAFPGLAVPGPGLVELPVVERDGVIWIVPTPGAATPDPALAGIGDDFASYGIAGHRHWRSHRFDLAMNWKLVIDTFLEPYHFASLHRATVGPLFIANLCHAQRFGPHVREVLPRRSLTELRAQPRDRWDIVPHSAIVYVLFPNTVFVMQIDHIETWRAIPHPTDPGRCVCDLDFYIPEGEMTESAQRHWERNWNLTIDTVIQEDFAAMAGVQLGMASGVLPSVRHGANEPALSMFHAALAEALG